VTIVTTKRSAARGKRSAARGRTRASRPAEEQARSRRGASGDALSERQRRDLAAIALGLVGVLGALALWAGALGPAGRLANRAAAWLLGPSRMLVPALLLVLGASALRRRRAPGTLEALGAALAIVVAAGLADLVGGGSWVDAPPQALEHAGGMLGALVGGGLARVVGTAGAAAVLVAALAAAAVVATERSVSGLGRALLAAVRKPFGRAKPQRGLEGASETAGATSPAAAGGPDEDGSARGWFDRPALEADAALERFGVAGEGDGASAPGSAGDEPEGVGAAAVERAGSAAAGARRGAEVDVAGIPARAEARVDDGGPVGGSAGGLLVADPARAAGTSTGLDAEGAAGAEATPEDAARGASQGSLELDGPVWRLPPRALLRRSRARGPDERELDRLGKVLVEALASHGVVTRLVGRTVGPTVTRYELELGPGVKVARVTSLSRDIAYAMAAADVRILAPIPGRSAIGVEVPNRRRELVTLGDVLASPEGASMRHPLEVALGRDVAGRTVVVNLAEMPHVLISGATGSGKSSCINSMLATVLMRATPDEVRLVLVDPKRVELCRYEGVPHLLTDVIVEPKRAAGALGWAVSEMERRYGLLAAAGARDLDSWRRSAAGSTERLPYVLIVVDELNDLMMVAPREVEDSICRIAQMARAVGMHLVIATQRPSVDVITGVIKANIPSRIAFAVSSFADSRVVLDQGGAERLVGKGDMLLVTGSSSVPRRLQAPWVSEPEIEALVAHWRSQREPEFLEALASVHPEGGGQSAASDEDDELLPQAMELVVRSQLGSTSMLQRKLRVGFARAGRLMDLLERRGVVGPADGPRPRQVLMSEEELEALKRR
jgi:S-DNA-T family DNA segregation ATPase FtsK/SpoIIIE